MGIGGQGSRSKDGFAWCEATRAILRKQGTGEEEGGQPSASSPALYDQ
jgi:hypothetical protein